MMSPLHRDIVLVIFVTFCVHVFVDIGNWDVHDPLDACHPGVEIAKYSVQIIIQSTVTVWIDFPEIASIFICLSGRYRTYLILELRSIPPIL
jgi:hypothetical protein